MTITPHERLEKEDRLQARAEALGAAVRAYLESEDARLMNLSQNVRRHESGAYINEVNLKVILVEE